LPNPASDVIGLELPAGVRIQSLTPHADSRGVFMELFRSEWATEIAPIQWNAVRSEANVMRGVHVHTRHADYLTVVAGTMLLGLYDLRRDSPTSGMSAMITLGDDSPDAVTIPPGVCHGFYFPVPAVTIYAVSHYWDETDELGCRFDDPQLGLSWPMATPILSDRDRDAGSVDEMRATFEQRFVPA
jgi:dTDP-4-dehydrorhamnose 3,5-epimerase